MDNRRQIGLDLLDLEPSSIIELYELYINVDDPPIRFHAGSNGLKNIIYNSLEYFSIPVDVEGFETNMSNRLPRPKLTIANVDNLISGILRNYSDLRSSAFIRIKIFLKNLDQVNFENSINPFGIPQPLNYISKEKYLISQKILENKNIIQFELITPFDLQTLQTATRSIYGRYCYWQYRGSGCNYQGDLICQENDKNFSVSPSRERGQFIRDVDYKFINNSVIFNEAVERFKWVTNKYYEAGDIVFTNNIDFNGIKDPPKTFFVCIKSHKSSNLIFPHKSIEYWEKDSCSKTLQACKKRFADGVFIGNSYTAYNDSVANLGVLPFGGFPGTDNFQYEV